jgi:hypothetical protein
VVASVPGSEGQVLGLEPVVDCRAAVDDVRVEVAAREVERGGGDNKDPSRQDFCL